MTRLNLSAFVQADLRATVSQVVSNLSEFKNQEAADGKALGIVQQQLNPVTDASTISQEDMNAAIQSASSKTRAQIFYMAREVRSENWRNQQTKPKMERTIPIFRALISSDTDDIFHANHGQLGFALKDQRDPDWREDESELSKAINLRGPWEDHGWLFYEFNRAHCQIQGDQEFNRGEETNEKIKQSILDDLRDASHAPNLYELIFDDPIITKWMKNNNLTEVDFDTNDKPPS